MRMVVGTIDEGELCANIPILCLELESKCQEALTRALVDSAQSWSYVEFVLNAFRRQPSLIARCAHTDRCHTFFVQVARARTCVWIVNDQSARFRSSNILLHDIKRLCAAAAAPPMTRHRFSMCCELALSHFGCLLTSRARIPTTTSCSTPSFTTFVASCPRRALLTAPKQLSTLPLLSLLECDLRRRFFASKSFAHERFRLFRDNRRYWQHRQWLSAARGTRLLSNVC